MGAGGSILKDTTLGKTLGDWTSYAYPPMIKRKMVFYCNTAWPIYALDFGERWPLSGSLNYYIVLQLGLFCQRLGKCGKVLYV